MPGAPQNTVIGGASLWVLAGKKPEEYKGVAKFFSYLSSPEVQSASHKRTGYLPITTAAYQLTERTILRGGYALSYLPTFDLGYSNGFSVTTPLVSSTDGGITPAVTLSNPYPNGLDQPIGSAQGLASLVGRGFMFSSRDRTIPYVHQFSAGMQRELRGRDDAEARSVRSDPGGRGGQHP